MRRYEFSEGNSSKFWEVQVVGSDLSVRFGRIGTNGQITMKNCGDAAAAMRERDKLIREKTGKGYVEVDAASGACGVPIAPTGTARPLVADKTSRLPSGQRKHVPSGMGFR